MLKHERKTDDLSCNECKVKRVTLSWLIDSVQNDFCDISPCDPGSFLGLTIIFHYSYLYVDDDRSG